MGLLSFSTTFVRYAVEGELPANFLEFATERVMQNAYRDIDDNFEERSVGWVSVMNMFDAAFEYASFLVGDHIVLTLRIDERKVAPKVLKKFTLKEEARLLVITSYSIHYTKLYDIVFNFKLLSSAQFWNLPLLEQARLLL